MKQGLEQSLRGGLYPRANISTTLSNHSLARGGDLALNFGDPGPVHQLHPLPDARRLTRISQLNDAGKDSPRRRSESFLAPSVRCSAA